MWFYTDYPGEEPKELLLTHAWFFNNDEEAPVELAGRVYIRSTAIAAIETMDER